MKRIYIQPMMVAAEQQLTSDILRHSMVYSVNPDEDLGDSDINVFDEDDEGYEDGLDADDAL